MIKRLYVNNFRCLENFELSLAGRTTSLLIGGNGSGKSTISYALEVFQKIALGTNRIGQIVKPSAFSIGRLDVPMRFEIEVDIRGVNYEYTLALELAEGFKEIRVFEEIFRVAGKSIYSRNGSHVQLVGTKQNKEANFLVDWHLAALPVIQEQSVVDPLYIFKTWLAQMLILSPVPSLMSGDSDGESLTPTRNLSNFGSWFSGLLAHSPSAYAQIDKYLKGVMPDFKDIKNPFIGTDLRSLNIQFQQDQVTLNLPFRDLSDAEKCFFICAVVLAANDSYGPLFCFWDEPDNYLSPSEVGFFIMALRRSFHTGGQLLVTSHNLEAIRHFSDEDILVLDRRSHLDPTLIRPRSDLIIHGDLGNALIRGDVTI